MKLYSNGCPKCNLTKRILAAKDIAYEEISDMDVIMEKAKEIGANTLPFLEDNGQYSTGQDAVVYAQNIEVA